MKPFIRFCLSCIALCVLLASCEVLLALPKKNGEKETETEEPVPETEPEKDPEIPVILPASGPVKALSYITMTSETAGSTIYYTEDGTDPTTASTVYDSAKQPFLLKDTTYKAIAVKGEKSSAIASASFTITPYFTDFSLSLAAGMRWNFHYTWRHSVNYSYSDKPFTVDQDFSIILTAPKTIGGIEFFQCATTGSASRVRWKYLAFNDYKLLGSKDGTTYTILFDAMYGFWAGQCFFTEYSKDRILTATPGSEGYTISQGWQFEDNDSAYYPGTGTIYDPDPYSGFANTVERYQSGIGPCYWRDSSGSTTSSSSTSDTYTITLTNFETGVDVSAYIIDAVLSENKLIEISAAGSTVRLEAPVSSNYADYIYYAESLSGGDPVLSVYSWPQNMSALVNARNSLSGSSENAYLSTPGGTCTIQIDGLPAAGGKVRVCYMKVGGVEINGQYFTGVTSSECTALTPGSSVSANLAGDDMEMYTTAANFGTKMYCFAIPVTATLDLRLTLVKYKLATPGGYSFSGNDFLRYANNAGVGLPEAFAYSSNSTISAFAQVWEDADNDNQMEIAGDYIFGWGAAN